MKETFYLSFQDSLIDIAVSKHTNAAAGIHGHHEVYKQVILPPREIERGQWVSVSPGSTLLCLIRTCDGTYRGCWSRQHDFSELRMCWAQESQTPSSRSGGGVLFIFDK